MFKGPSDLAVDMGHIGQAGAPEMKEAVLSAMRKIVASGKAAGLLTSDQELQFKSRDIGARFIASDLDVSLFARNMRAAARSSKDHLAIESQQRFTMSYSSPVWMYRVKICV